HSLGGALATVAARLCGSGLVAGLYTFGSPMVGDRKFQNSFHLPAWRFVNNADIIARNPKFGLYWPIRFPIFARYRRVGDLNFINSDGSIEAAGRQPFDLIGHLRLKFGWPLNKLADHAPLRYAIYIWNEYIMSIRLSIRPQPVHRSFGTRMLKGILK